MIYFRNDYSTLGHPKILDTMQQALVEHHVGYGLDEHCNRARASIQKHLQRNGDIHFLVGGTSANKIVISHLLRPYEAVIAVQSGHIEVHEAGAIEQTGHKILTVPGRDGKITVQEIEQMVLSHPDEHMVVPKMVYISQATELGTVYQKQELFDISSICKKYGLYLFVDGARLGASLTSKKTDFELKDIEAISDVFYIGGTKNGALLGEAVVVLNDSFKEAFRHSMKQSGGLLAKGFLIGLQFEVLFEHRLFFELAQQANELAKSLEKGLKQRNIQLIAPVETNQLFVEMEKDQAQALAKEVSFEIWTQKQTTTVFRLVTSWSQTEKDLDKLYEVLDRITKRKS